MQDTKFVYRPRSPESTHLYSVVAQNLETFLARQQDRAGRSPVLLKTSSDPICPAGFWSEGFYVFVVPGAA